MLNGIKPLISVSLTFKTFLSIIISKTTADLYDEMRELENILRLRYTA